jgi:hypothetical protein
LELRVLKTKATTTKTSAYEQIVDAYLRLAP